MPEAGGKEIWHGDYGRVGATFNSLENICVRNVKCVKKRRERKGISVRAGEGSVEREVEQ